MHREGATGLQHVQAPLHLRQLLLRTRGEAQNVASGPRERGTGAARFRSQEARALAPHSKAHRRSRAISQGIGTARESIGRCDSRARCECGGSGVRARRGRRARRSEASWSLAATDFIAFSSWS